MQRWGRTALAGLMLMTGCDEASLPAGPAGRPVAPMVDAATAAMAPVRIEAQNGQFALTYSLRNTGAAPLSLTTWPAPTLIDAAGTRHPALTQAMAVDQNFFGTLQTDLAPGADAEVKAVWQLPADLVDRATWRVAFPGHENEPVPLP